MRVGMIYGASIAYEVGGGPPSEYTDIWTPLGIAFPLAMVKKFCPGVKIRILDQAFRRMSNENLLDLMLTEEFDLLGFSSYVWNSSAILDWIAQVKKEKPDIKIVVGGPHLSYIAEDIMHRMPGIDFIIAKEGEIPFLRLVEKLEENDSNYGRVPSLIYRENSKIVKTPVITPPIDLDEYASPYLSGVLDEYFSGNCKYFGVQTSRGCPFSCDYCAWNCQSTYENVPKVRYFSSERILAELKFLEKKLGPEALIEVLDATFNEDQRRLLELSQRITDNQIHLRYGVRIRADLLNAQQMSALKSMGVWIIKVGIESVGESLKTVNRVQSLQRIKQNLLEIKKAGIYISGNIMIGLPNQTEKEIINTIKYTKNLGIDVFTINIFDPPPSTEIYHAPEKFGMKELKRSEDGRKLMETYLLSRKTLMDLGKYANNQLNFDLNEFKIREIKTLKAFS